MKWQIILIESNREIIERVKLTMEQESSDNNKIVVIVNADLEELIPDFLANRREDLQSISKSLEAGDYEKIRVLGHSMKGSGGGYGFDRISEIGKSIEDAAKEKNAEIIRRSNEELSNFLDRVEIQYE